MSRTGKKCKCGQSTWRWDHNLCSGCGDELPDLEQRGADAELALVVKWLKGFVMNRNAQVFARELEQHAHRKEPTG